MSHLGPSLRRSARRARRPWRRAALALVLSLLVNALILREVDVRWSAIPRPAPPPAEVALAPLSAQEWAANRAIGKQQSASRPPDASRAVPAPQPVAPPPPPRNMPGQVVETAPSKNDTPPKDSRFVSEHNSTVEKETRSRDARFGYKNVLPKKSAPDAATAEKVTPPAPSATASAAQQQKSAPKRGEGPRPGAAAPQRALPGDAARDRLALLPQGELRNPLRPGPAPRPSGEGGKEHGDGLPQTGGESGETTPGDKGPLAKLDLRPGASAYDKIAGGPSPDHLDGVEEGDATYLNTREWKYAGYFNRIKQAVGSQWDPGSSLAARDPTGSHFSDRDWQTLVKVRLDSVGGLKGVYVERTSGLDFLDRIALEAFQKAQPFANPPAGLADEHGEIVFSFGFYVQTGGSGLRIFRNHR